MLASNDDKNYRNTCMHHIKPTGIALRTRTRTNTNPNDTEANAAGTSVVNWHRSLYDLCTIAVCEGLDPFAVPNKELNRTATEVLSSTHVPAARDKLGSASCKETECTACTSSSISSFRLCMKCQLCHTLAPMLLLAILVNMKRKRRMAAL